MLLINISTAYAQRPNYTEALKTSANAALKQSGLEADFFKVKSAANTRAKKFIKYNGLETPAAVIGFMVPVLYKKRVRVKTGDFIFTGTNNGVNATWTLQF